MRILTLVVLRLMGVLLLRLVVAIGCLIFDAHRSIEDNVFTTGSRVNQHLRGLNWQRLLWRGGMERGALLPLPDRKSLTTQSIIPRGFA